MKAKTAPPNQRFAMINGTVCHHHQNFEKKVNVSHILNYIYRKSTWLPWIRHFLLDFFLTPCSQQSKKSLTAVVLAYAQKRLASIRITFECIRIFTTHQALRADDGCSLNVHDFSYIRFEKILISSETKHQKWHKPLFVPVYQKPPDNVNGSMQNNNNSLPSIS